MAVKKYMIQEEQKAKMAKISPRKEIAMSMPQKNSKKRISSNPTDKGNLKHLR